MTKRFPMLEAAARALHDLRDEVVFVGGATLGLYVEDPAAPEVRATDDVDCIIEVVSRLDYPALEERLRKRGLRNDTSQGAPLCRWLSGDEGLQLDVMPTEASILGFTNRWYTPGMQHKQTRRLTDGQSIFILTAPFFLGTKLEAFQDPERGQRDFRFSKDLEDVIAVLDGRPGLAQELDAAPDELRGYLREQFLQYLQEEDFSEAVEGFMRFEGAARQRRLFGLLRRFVQTGT